MTPKAGSSGLLITLLYFVHLQVSAGPLVSPGSFTVPFHLIAKLIIVEATVDDHTGLFILDTGTEELILNAAHVNRPTGGRTIRDVGGHSAKLKTGYFSFSLGKINIKQKRAFLADLRHLERNRNIHILGLIGYSILEDYEIVLDYTAKKLTFFELDRKGNRLTASSGQREPSHIIPFKLKGHFPCFDIRIGGESFFVALDTGAGLNVLDARVRERIACSADGKRANIKGISRQQIQTVTLLMDGFQIEEVPYPSMLTIFKSLDRLNEFITGRDIDGLLGYEFLHHYRTALNYRKKELSVFGEEPVLARLKKE